MLFLLLVSSSSSVAIAGEDVLVPLPFLDGSLACSLDVNNTLYDCARAASTRLPTGISAEELISQATSALFQAVATPRDAAAEICLYKGSSSSCLDVAERALVDAFASSRLESLVAMLESATGRRATRLACSDSTPSESDLIVTSGYCMEDGLRALKMNGILVATEVCEYSAPSLDVSIFIEGDTCLTIVLKRPGRSIAQMFRTHNMVELVHHALAWKSAETRTGLGSCTEAQAQEQGQLWTALRDAEKAHDLTAPESWESASLLGCPESIDSTVFAVADEFVRVVHVGANKGYGLARQLSLLVPNLGITTKRWGDVLIGLGARHACGWCRDCLEDPPTIDASRDREKRHVVAVEAHLVEPLGANISLLRAVLNVFGFSASKDPTTRGEAWEKQVGGTRATVYLHRLAAGEASSRELFPKLKAGDEVGSFCADSVETCEAMFAGRFEDDDDAFEEVRVERLDKLLEEFPGKVDALVIDAEGSDPLILAGSRDILSSKSRFLQFEYHFRGAWMPPQSLKAVVGDLDVKYGFDCYLHGPDSTLWRLSSGCWNDAFELRQWSNVACVKRSDVHLHLGVSSFAAVGVS